VADVLAVERLPGEQAGREQAAGWIAPDGRFYPVPHWGHITVAAQLRAAGHGPEDPWDMRDGWVMVRAHGEAVALPDRVTQAQLDCLGDMLLGAPDGPYRSHLLASLRSLLALTAGRS
jgi:hypothetical protein